LVVINDEDYAAARRNRLVAPGGLVRMPGIGIDTGLYSRSEIDSQDFACARHDLGVGPDTPLFVTVGELSRNKRNSDVIEALALTRHKEAVLVLAGEGPERDRLHSLVGERGLRDRVCFAGSVADVRPVVGTATALVLASDREGLARAIMEALALEVPVIASTARGNRELVDPDCGFVYPTGDAQALAARMDWLIDHPVERLDMGRRGRQRMVERYDIGKLIRLHCEMYAGMLAGRDKRRR
jgi:glycosyltransferase EpsD